MAATVASGAEAARALPRNCHSTTAMAMKSATAYTTNGTRNPNPMSAAPRIGPEMLPSTKLEE